MKATINIEMLNEIMDNDDELIRECFADFKSDYRESLSRIKNSLDTNDADALQKSAHAFKGSLKYLAADNAADYALELEYIGRSGKIDEKQANSAFENLQSACEDLAKFMDDY